MNLEDSALRDLPETRLRVLTDSSAARGIVRRAGSGRVKHLETRYLWIQDRVRRKQLEIGAIDTSLNTSDLGTKFHPRSRLEELLQMMPLVIGMRLGPVTALLVTSALAPTAMGQGEMCGHYGHHHQYDTKGFAGGLLIGLMIAAALFFILFGKGRAGESSTREQSTQCANDVAKQIASRVESELTQPEALVLALRLGLPSPGSGAKKYVIAKLIGESELVALDAIDTIIALVRRQGR